MDINKIVVPIIAIFVCSVVFVGVLPIFENVTAETDVLTNDGLYRVEFLTVDSEEKVIEWDHTNPGVITVDNVDLTMQPTGNIPYTLICGTESWFLRYNWNGSNAGGIDMINENGGVQYSATIALGNDITITLNGGTATIQLSNEDNARSKTYDTCYSISLTGDYVMKKPNKTAYMFEDSPIYIVGRSTWTGGAVNVEIEGTIGDGVNITLLDKPTWTISNEDIIYSEVNNYVDLLSFDSITFTITSPDETPIVKDLVFSQVIVPYEVTAERSVHPDMTLSTLIELLPLVIVAGLVIGAVTWFLYYKRN